jgi:hypothetical protein
MFMYRLADHARASDVTQSRSGKVEAGLAIRECANNPCPPSDLSHDPL